MFSFFKRPKVKKIDSLEKNIEEKDYRGLVYSAFQHGIDNGDWVSAYHYMHIASKELGMDESVVNALQKLSKKPSDSEALHTVGSTFVASSRYDIALHFFKTSFELNKEDKNVLSYLAECYLSTQQYREVINLLRTEIPPIHILEYSMLAHLCLNEVNDAKEVLETFKEALSENQNNSEDPYIEYCNNVQTRMEGIYGRFMSMETSHKDMHLVHWRKILFNSVVINTMDNLKDQEDISEMNGRYAFLNITKEQIHSILENLKKYTNHNKLVFDKIIYENNAAGKIIAMVLGHKYNLPVTPLTSETDREKSLLVLVRNIDYSRALSKRSKNQFAFVFTSDWTKRGMFSADAVGVLAQFAMLYWEQEEGEIDVEKEVQAILESNPDDAFGYSNHILDPDFQLSDEFLNREVYELFSPVTSNSFQ